MPANRYAPFLPVVARHSAPVDWLRITIATSGSGVECKSVSRPESEPDAASGSAACIRGRGPNGAQSSAHAKTQRPGAANRLGPQVPGRW